jgi:ribosomal protein S18 acetylase RimI-like enzyme
VNSLWVGEPYRHRGFGSQMLRTAEEEALRLGCHSAHLDTFGFQARPFYERNGYRVFGELPDYPEGYTRYYMVKRLISTPAA